jgi:hypothetical protein
MSVKKKNGTKPCVEQVPFYSGIRFPETYYFIFDILSPAPVDVLDVCAVLYDAV